MSFRLTRLVLAAEKHGAWGHMAKWWAKHKKVDGQVIQTLSPYEQHIFKPWFKYAFKNVRFFSFFLLSFLFSFSVCFVQAMKKTTNVVSRAWLGFLWFVGCIGYGKMQAKQMIIDARP